MSNSGTIGSYLPKERIMEYQDPTKLSAYFFGNMYISQIAHGIQAAHVVTKMFAKYGREHEGGASIAGDVLYDWADVGVTKILLNGGYQSNLADVHSIFEIVCPRLGLPFAKFHEEEAALNGALTSVGVVVPAEIYDLYKGVSSLEIPMDTLNGRDPADILEWSRLTEQLLILGGLEERKAVRALYHTLKTARLA